jgi:hypothetical protein
VRVCVLDRVLFLLDTRLHSPLITPPPPTMNDYDYDYDDGDYELKSKLFHI